MSDSELVLPDLKGFEDQPPVADTPQFEAPPPDEAVFGSGLRVGKRRGNLTASKTVPATDPDLGIPVPGPVGAPTDNRSLGNVTDAFWREGTTPGVAANAADLALVRSDNAPEETGDPFVDLGKIGIGGPTGAPMEAVAPRGILDTAAGQAQRKADAEDAFFSQIAREFSPTSITPTSIAGAVIGSALAPESLGGLSGLLVRQFPKLAARPILTSALDAAIVNAITDPAIQGERIATGQQEGYDVAQTAMAPVVGFVAGGALGAAAHGAGVAADLAARAEREGVPIDGAAVDRYIAIRDAEEGRQARRQEFTPEQPKAPEQPGTAKPDTLTGKASARFPDQLTDRPLSARVSAPAIQQDLGVDIPGTLLRGFALPEAAAPEPGGLTAYHGSPHDFYRFSLDKIGTGEGAQAFGHGLYFAEKFDTANYYRESLTESSAKFSHPDLGDNLTVDNVDRGILVAVRDAAPGLDRATADMISTNVVDGMRMGSNLDDMLRFTGRSDWAPDEKAGWIAALQKAKEYTVSKPEGRLYEVRLKAEPDRFLDWDAPFSQQPAPVQEALRKFGIDGKTDPTGGAIYESSKIVPGDHADKVAAAAALKDAGIVGVRYLDGGSRADGDGTRNYVVFDDNLIDIVAKDGVPLKTPAKLPDSLQGAGEAKLGEATTASYRPAMRREMPAAPARPAVGDKPAAPAQPGKPLSLTQFIARNGGLVLDGEAKARDLGKMLIPGAGPLARKNGRSVDGFWREALIEHGYLPPDKDGGAARDITKELFDAIERERQGERTYSAQDRDRIPEAKQDNQSKEIEAEAKRITKAHEALGIDRSELDTRSLYDAAEMMWRGEETDHLSAYERATTMRALADEDLARDAREVFRDLPPGWEEPDAVQRSTARGDGGAPGETRSGGEKSGPEGRSAGAGEVVSGSREGGQGQDSHESLTSGSRQTAEPIAAEMLLRRRGTQPSQPLPPNQIAHGRPVADQGTAAATAKVSRLEDLGRQIVDAFEALGREGRVTPGALGQFSQRTGVLRVKSLSDLDTLTHEVGHSFHMERDAKPDVDRLLAANKAELQALGIDNGSTGPAEAFAELFRLYATNRGYAFNTYPQATAALEALLKAKFPEQFKALEAMRSALDALHRAPSGEVVTADTISAPPPRFGDGLKEALASDRDPSGRTIYSAMDALYTSTIDKLHPLYRAVTALVDVAKGNGKTIDVRPADDAYVLARLLPGAHGGADTMLRHGVIPAGEVQPQGPSFSEAIEKALGQKWDEQGFADFGAYLTSRRMVAEYERFFNGELPNPPGKFSLADYEKAVTEFETKYPAFAEAAEDLYAFQTNHLQRMFDKGLVTKEYFDLAMSRRDYVPFVRDMADFKETPTVGSTGGGATLRTSVMKTFRGSQRSVVNPLESIFKRVHDLEFFIARNDVVNALDNLAQSAGPGSGAIAERIPSNQLKGQKVDVIEALRAAGKAGNVDELDLEALIRQTEDLLGDSTWTSLFRQEPIQDGGEPIVYGWRNGQRYAVRLADGRFGQELYHALTAMHETERNWFMSVLQISQQALRTGVTRAFDFLLVNLIRDQLTATVTAGRKYVPFISAMRGIADIWSKSDTAKAYAGFGGLAGGAVVGAIDHSQFGKNVKALQKGSILSKIGQVFEASEAGTRLGLFRSYMEQGKAAGFDEYNAAVYAAFKAQDYVDFRKAGASFSGLRRIVPFLNASVQGTDREARALVDLPVLEAKRAKGATLTATETDRLKDARVAWVRVMGMGAILGTGAAVLNAEHDEYQNASQYTRDSNFLFKFGDHWVAVPKPFGFVRAIVNAFERGAEYAIRKDPSLATTWLEGAAQGLALPTENPLLKLIKDLPANYDSFRDKPIVPYYLQGVKPEEQYTPYTSELSKWLGQVTGWSPMKIEYAVQNLGASQALDLLKTADAMMGKERPEKQVYDYPVLRRFVKNLERGAEASTAFYNLVGEKSGKYEQAENAYRVKIRNGERQGAEKYLRELPEDERAWTILSTQGFDASEKRLHPMMSARDHVGVISGMVSQLNSNNLIHEADVDKRDTTRSRRDAEPIALNPTIRAKAMEELQELSVAVARNGMVAIGAKGTKGLGIMDTGPALARLRMISPEVADEYEARLKSKKVYDDAYVRDHWPETKRRLLTDGEEAELSDIVPPTARKKRKR